MQQNSKRKEPHIENPDSQVEFRQRNREFEPWQRVALELTSLMQQHNFDVLIHEEEHRLNMSKREEVILRYIFASLPYYRKEHEDEELEERT